VIYRNLELYNVWELLEGDGLAILPPEADRVLAPDDWVLRPENAEGLWLCRIPDVVRRKLNGMAQVNAIQGAGAEARFILPEAGSVTLRLKIATSSVVEVYQGCFQTGWQIIGPEGTDVTVTLPANIAELERVTAERGLPFDARLTRVMLPWRPAVRFLDVRGECTPPRLGQTPSLRYVAYGSSITHGNFGGRPTGGYAMRAAQLLGADLVNLGFGGGAHLEPDIAEHIAARDDWDVASLEMGINISGIGLEEFTRRVDRFVDIVAAAAARRKGLLCIDVFTCRDDLGERKWAPGYRRAVRRKVASLASPRVVHAAGDRLLTSPAGLTADLVHPSPVGMEEIARNLVRRLARLLGSRN